MSLTDQWECFRTQNISHPSFYLQYRYLLYKRYNWPWLSWNLTWKVRARWNCCPWRPRSGVVFQQSLYFALETLLWTFSVEMVKFCHRSNFCDYLQKSEVRGCLVDSTEAQREWMLQGTFYICCVLNLGCPVSC